MRVSILILGSLAIKFQQMQQEEDPTSPYLERPKGPPREEMKVEVKEEEVVVGTKLFSPKELMICLEQKLDIRNRTYHLKSYPNTFLGSELVTMLCNQEMGLQDRLAATIAGEHIREMGFFVHVSGKKNLLDGEYFYRLLHHSSPTVFSLSLLLPFLSRAFSLHCATFLFV